MSGSISAVAYPNGPEEDYFFWLCLWFFAGCIAGILLRGLQCAS